MELEERLASSLVDRYSIDGRIGRGGMATVFLAEDRKHRRKVAIKVLDPELSEAVGKRRFLQEIQTAARLTHPHILPLHDSGESEGLLFYVMPFVRGESLRDRLNRDEQLPVDEAVRITLEVSRALAYAHREGLVHRDVKPANILLESGQAVLADFGLAQALATVGGSDTRITQTGVSVGTPAYMSPEQAAGEQILDGRSDQYALACILYEMLAGEQPFPGSTPQAILAKKLSQPPPPLSLYRSSVPRGLGEVLRRALQKSPVDRFASMEEFSMALARATAGENGKFGTPGWIAPYVKGWAWLPGAVGASVVAVLVGTAMGWFGGSSADWGGSYPTSLVVLPFNTSSSSVEEQTVASALADLLAEELDWWDSIRAVGGTALSGTIHDLGISGPGLRSSREGVRVAGQTGAEALLAVMVRIREDSVLAQGTLYDAESGDLVGDPISVRGGMGDLHGLAVDASLRLLGLQAGEISPRTHGTDKLSALRAFLRGRGCFYRVDIPCAMEAFGQAIRVDSTYAPALSWLSLSLYWWAVEGSGRLRRVRSDMARYSTLAHEGLSRLRGPDSLHVAAFFAFQRGQYQESRELYRRLSELDPDDLVAWLMLGEQELNDLWLKPGETGDRGPRANLNSALAAFRRTTSIRPSFELGYARSFRVAEAIETTSRFRSCPLFGALKPDPVPPGNGPGLEDVSPFCPVFRDSVEWLPRPEFDALDRLEVQTGADRLFHRVVLMLEAWERFAPEAFRPKEYLAEVLIRRRDAMGVASPELLRREAVRALAYAEAALELRPDTALGDLTILANLHLAAGNPEQALAMAEQALARSRAEADSVRQATPFALANVYLASGQLETALTIARENRGRRLVRDSLTEEMVEYAGAEPLAYTLAILGAGEITGEPVRREMAKLDSVWTAAGYSARQKRVLYNSLSPRIGAVLVQDTGAYRFWETVADPEESLWGTLGFPDGGVPTREDVSKVVESASDRTNGGIGTFVVARRMWDSGELDSARQLLERMDSLPVRVDVFDTSWGFRATSLLDLAEILEAQGEYQGAEEAIQRFLSCWAEADSLGQRTVERAREQLQRMRESRSPGGG